MEDLATALGMELDTLIMRLETGFEDIPEDGTERGGCLSCLAHGLNNRYERHGDLQDLDAAIAISGARVEATPEDHLDRAGRLGNLRSHLSSRYERTGNLQDLEAAIAISEEGVKATGYTRWSPYSSNLIEQSWEPFEQPV